LECELLDRVTFRTPKEARTGVFDFIEGWYNPRRRHSALDYDSPLAFERRHMSSLSAASTIEPATDQTAEGDTLGGATS
jgi:putative transposase